MRNVPFALAGMPLERTLACLRRLAGKTSSPPGRVDLEWKDLIGDAAWLPEDLHAAVRDAPERDPLPEIRECWDLIRRRKCYDALRRLHAIERATRGQREGAGTGRLYRNAALMIATAGAAAGLRGAKSPRQAWDSLKEWWSLGGRRFRLQIGEDIACPGGWRADRVSEAARVLRAAGWETVPPAFWTRWWLDLVPPPKEEYAVPLAGYCAGRGFLAKLVLLAAEPDGNRLIEHPEGALRPFGESLLRAIATAAGNPRKAIAWRIRTAADPLFGSLPLDGDSLGAAATVGFRLFDADLTYDPKCLLIAAVGRGGALRRVGGELEKLALAKETGFTKAGVAFNTGLSGDQLRQAGPEKTVRLRTIEEARQFARATHGLPWL